MVRQIHVAILVVDENVCADEWAGVVRKEDVRATEKEKVVVGDSFRVGDVIRGEVVRQLVGFRSAKEQRSALPVPDRLKLIRDSSQISLGDQTNYYLTTARNELGVIMAESEEGNTMYPISWKEFRDPVTGENESRKVAKPF